MSHRHESRWVELEGSLCRMSRMSHSDSASGLTELQRTLSRPPDEKFESRRFVDRNPSSS